VFVHPGIVKGEAARDLPADIAPQRVSRLTILT